MNDGQHQQQRSRPRLRYRRRLVALVAVAAALGAPAVVLRVLCVGHACDEEADASSEVPFCSLPEEVRRPVVNGYRKGRSPEVIAIAAETPVAKAKGEPAWPSGAEVKGMRVPIVFSGPGVTGRVPAGRGLDDIAPTLAESINLERRFPEVRSGTAIPDVTFSDSPRVLLLVALKGVGASDLGGSRTPVLDRLLEEGAGSTEGTVESLPLDPVAAIATIGTGGVPRQHGIVGERIRNDEGELVPAWGEGAPVSVIASFGDDLDELLDGRPEIAVAGTSPTDRGLIGQDWYVDVDEDRASYSSDPTAKAVAMLGKGFGDDDIPDLLAVALAGSVRRQDSDLEKLVEAVDRTSGGRFVVAVAGTGSLRETRPVSFAEVGGKIDEEVPGQKKVVEAVAPGGVYLDQEALVATGVTEDEVIRPLKATEAQDSPLVVDAFASIAVSFSKYC